MDGSTIIYIGGFRFPNEDAGAKRVMGIGMCMRDAGYNVVFAGGEQGECVKKLHDNFEYYSQSELDRGGGRSLLQKLFDFFSAGKNTVNWLKLYRERDAIGAVILYNSSYIFLRRIKKFCTKYNVKLVADSTEWFDSSHLPGGKFGLVAVDNYLKMRFGYKSLDNMIVISQYLFTYYLKKNVNIINIPPLILKKYSLSNERISENNSSVKNIIYAGNPGKKDDLIKMIKVINENQLLFNGALSLTVIGITQQQFQELYPDVKIADNIFFKGRISYDEVIEEYRKVDFSIIIRPNKRYANAGFSTKFVESLSLGVPVIATNTSDMAKFLTNKENGFLLNSDTEDDIFKVFKQILLLTNEDLLFMKHNAKCEGEKFYYMAFTKTIFQFVETLV